MRSFLLAILLMTDLTALAQWKVAMINDADGYVNVRNGPGTGFGVIGTVDSLDLFSCTANDTSDWYEIVSSGIGPDGYVHKSRITFIEQLSSEKQGLLIRSRLSILLDFLRKYSHLSKDRIPRFLPQDSIWSLKLYGNEIAILQYLPSYLCSTGDSSVLDTLYQVLWLQRGDASENPAFALGECFICQTDLVIRSIQRIRNPELKNIILGDVEAGLYNVLYSKDSDVTENPQYIALMKKLEAIEE